MTGADYVVAVKESARRRVPAAGRWVNEEGPRRTFGSKELARRWAREISGPSRRVWIQDAAPADDSGADGYLVGGDRRGRGSAGDERGVQATLAPGT